MKKTLLILGLGATMLSSCVTLGKYEALEATNNQIRKEHYVTRQELLDLQEEYSTLQRQYQQQSTDLADMQAVRLNQDDSIHLLQAQIGDLQLAVDTLIENYSQKIAGQNKSLAQAQSLLASRTKELTQKDKDLAAKDKALDAKEKAMKEKEAEMQRKYNALEKQEAATKKALQAKEKELESVRNSVTKALVGFKDKGLKVEVKDSKVYVSMESKLMFASGSWTVSKEGQEAIKGLAKVLEENPDLNIMVEGHTDNVAFKSATAVKDNWDLSVMRATAIVKLILQHGPKINPARIEASGHSEYAPKVANDTPANKAINRRTEIILTPDLNALLKAVK